MTCVCSMCRKPFEPDLKSNGEPYKVCPQCRKRYMKRRKKRNQSTKERREWLKEHCFCVDCGREWAEPGRVRCKACIANVRERAKKYDPDNAKAYARRKARIEAGLCIDCGKPTVNGQRRCPKCLSKRRDSCRKWRIMQKIDKEAEKARNRIIP